MFAAVCVCAPGPRHPRSNWRRSGYLRDPPRDPPRDRSFQQRQNMAKMKSYKFIGFGRPPRGNHETNYREGGEGRGVKRLSRGRVQNVMVGLGRGYLLLVGG